MGMSSGKRGRDLDDFEEEMTMQEGRDAQRKHTQEWLARVPAALRLIFLNFKKQSLLYILNFIILNYCPYQQMKKMKKFHLSKKGESEGQFIVSQLLVLLKVRKISEVMTRKWMKFMLRMWYFA